MTNLDAFITGLPKAGLHLHFQGSIMDRRNTNEHANGTRMPCLDALMRAGLVSATELPRGTRPQT